MTAQFPIEAYRGDEPFAFVSYAHEDADRVFAELEYLSGAGIRFYYDEGIHPGHAWHDDLASAIERCGVFVIFLTERSLQSRNCLRELTFALDRHRDVVAVHLDPVVLPSGVQLALGDRQAILRDRFDEATYRTRLESALRDFLGDTRSDSPSSALPQWQPPLSPAATQPRRIKRPAILAVMVLVVVLVGGGLWRWQAAEAARAAERLADFVDAARADNVAKAFMAARELTEAQKRTDEFLALWPDVATPVHLDVATPGATVSFRPYGGSSESLWIPLGTAPLDDAIALPNDVIEVRVEKAEFETGHHAVRVPGPTAQQIEGSLVNVGPVAIELTPKGAIAIDMVRVPATDFPVFVTRWTSDVLGSHRAHVPSFAVAKREVSNREYQDFVDARGYDDARYWQGLPVDRGAFVDSTGYPGPASWTLGHFAEGAGDLPVSGVSWHEAVAYARYRDAQLPTIHHWARYAMAPWEGMGPVLPALSAAGNFNQTGALTTRASRALGPWGTFDTAGNVREWLWNEVGDERLAMGGSWNDYASESGDLTSVDPSTRGPTIGIRLMRTLEHSGIDAAQLAAITPVGIEMARQPVADEAFTIMRAQFSAQRRRPVSVEIETVDGTDTWLLERHVLHYDGDAIMRIYVMKPQRTSARYQAIVLAPHSGAMVPQAAKHLRAVLSHAKSVVRTGRWVFMPEWLGTFSRRAPPPANVEELSERQRRAALAWYQDSSDTLEYIATFDAIDQDHIGLLAESYGSVVIAPIILALQPMYKAAVLVSAGVVLRPMHPMVDSVNYLPRVIQPVLTANGRFDPTFPRDTSQQPFFDALGTPAAEKRSVVYEGGHFRYPPNLLAAEIAAWYDRYLGKP